MRIFLECLSCKLFFLTAIIISILIGNKHCILFILSNCSDDESESENIVFEAPSLEFREDSESRKSDDEDDNTGENTSSSLQQKEQRKKGCHAGCGDTAVENKLRGTQYMYIQMEFCEKSTLRLTKTLKIRHASN